MPRGGKREGAGRAKGKSAKVVPFLNKDFAIRVLDRIGEGVPKQIKTAEDYQLSLLFDHDVQTRSFNFFRLFDLKYGKQTIRRDV